MTDDKKPKLIPVKKIYDGDKAVVIEWQEKGRTKRGSIPTAEYAEKVDADLLAASIPYGVPFEDMPLKQFTGEDLADAIHAAGVWTEEQVRVNAQKLVGVLRELYGIDLGKIVEFSAKYKQ